MKSSLTLPTHFGLIGANVIEVCSDGKGELTVVHCEELRRERRATLYIHGTRLGTRAHICG